jgi:hypothetical protein
MNTENITMIYNALRNDADVRKGFRMHTWGMPDVHKCNTIGCIAGWTSYLVTGRIKSESCAIVAKDYLELTNNISDDLFLPGLWVMRLYKRKDLRQHFGIGHNDGASLETVEDMRHWAKDYVADDEDHINLFDPIYYIINADVAAAAIAGISRHPGYVNWKEAVENPELELQF